MYERSERKSATHADGSSEDHLLTERSASGLTEVLLLPVCLTTVAVVCWLIIQAGVRLGTVINPPEPTGTSYLVHEK